MGCRSAGTEEDAGTLYPTLIQDSNGNQITLVYSAGLGVTWRNSSGRLVTIQDTRATLTNPTYRFLALWQNLWVIQRQCGWLDTTDERFRVRLLRTLYGV